MSGGPHTGFRANHAKGVLVTGSFTPAKAAAALSKAPHFAKTVPVLVRFSNGTGVPTLPDADPNASPHGVAIRFQLAGSNSTDIVSSSSNGFPVATPEKPLSESQAKAASPNYLMDESRNGLPRGPSNFAGWPNWPRTVTRSTTRPRFGPPSASWWNWARSA